MQWPQECVLQTQLWGYNWPRGLGSALYPPAGAEAPPLNNCSQPVSQCGRNKRQAHSLMSLDSPHGWFGLKDSMTASLKLPHASQQSRTLPLNLTSFLLHTRSSVLHGLMVLPVFPVFFSQRYSPSQILACLTLSWCLWGWRLTPWIWFKKSNRK